MVRNREQELATLIDSVQQAGAHVRKLVRDGFEVQTKADHSPVTTVDHEVNRILYDMQRREFPSDGWLSEESPDDLAEIHLGQNVRGVDADTEPRDIDAFVEHVDSEDIVEFSRLQLSDSLFANLDRVLAGKCNGP